MSEPQRADIGGSRLLCMHCRHDAFTESSILLNTSGLTFFGLEWLNDSARVLACANCGFLHWFARSAAVVAVQSREGKCRLCGGPLPRAANSCGTCGCPSKDPSNENA